MTELKKHCCIRSYISCTVISQCELQLYENGFFYLKVVTGCTCTASHHLKYALRKFVSLINLHDICFMRKILWFCTTYRIYLRNRDMTRPSHKIVKRRKISSLSGFGHLITGQ